MSDIEVFYMSEDDIAALPPRDRDDYAGPGWYWWPCFPGCLPDGDPVGPFPTHRRAWLDACAE